MSKQYLMVSESPQVPPYGAQGMAQGLTVQLGRFLYPLLRELDEQVDKRLVRTFVQTIECILSFRDRVNGLLLTELGSLLLGAEHAPAGTKRLSNLLRSPRWKAELIAHFLFGRACQQLDRWQEQGEPVLAIWDESVLEKPESLAPEDLCAVRSTKAARLTHVKPGYYCPPTRPVFVPGLHWLAVVLVGVSVQAGPPLLAVMRWWSTRGVHASFKRDEELRLLRFLLQAWGRQVLHIFDQGYAGRLWLGVLLAFHLRFLLRWRSDYALLDAHGVKRPAWQILRGQRSWGQRPVRGKRGRLWVTGGVLAAPVRHPEYPDTPLWLLVARRRGQTPWYLLTAEPITTEEEAWHLAFAYARRWQIELTWRYDKSELAFQSPRVYQGEAREKLLLLATLVYAFLLSLLAPSYALLRLWLLRTYCHRTGRHLRQVRAPLSRLRQAIGRLWQEHPPNWAALATSPTR